MSRSCEEDPAFDYLLMLFLETTAEPLTVLPTHRIVRGLEEAGVDALWRGLDELFAVRSADPEALVEAFGSGSGEGGGTGRFGLWTRGRGAILTARRSAFAPLLPDGGPAFRGLDVVLLGAALERLAGIAPDAVAASGRLAFTKSVDEAIDAVDARTTGPTRRSSSTRRPWRRSRRSPGRAR